MNLINAKPSGVNPFLPPAEQEREKKSLAESTVEDKLRNYTQSKRGTSALKSHTKHNPMLHIPKDDEPQQTVKSVTRHTGQITIDINRIIIDEILDDALRRFNTCHCMLAILYSIFSKITFAPGTNLKFDGEELRQS